MKPIDETQINYAHFLLGKKVVVCRWLPENQYWVYEYCEEYRGTILRYQVRMEEVYFLNFITPSVTESEIELLSYVLKKDKEKDWQCTDKTQFNKVVHHYADLLQQAIPVGDRHNAKFDRLGLVRQAKRHVQTVCMNSSVERLRKLWDTSNWAEDQKQVKKD